MIVGTGNDLVDIRRIERALKKHGKRFEERTFTEKEQAYARSKKNARAVASTYAKRFAAKEACAKALGTGHALGVYFSDIEVTRDKQGAPSLKLSGVAKKHLADITPKKMKAELHLALSDEYPYAIAHVIISVVPTS